MNVIELPSLDRLRAISDFEGKLVTSKLVGTAKVLTSVPPGVSWSRKIGEAIPKLPSTAALFQTLFVLPMAGNEPLSVAPFLGHDAVTGQFGGKAWPTVTVAAVPLYTLRETTRLPGLKPEKETAAEKAEGTTPSRPMNASKPSRLERVLAEFKSLNVVINGLDNPSELINCGLTVASDYCATVSAMSQACDEKNGRA